MNFTPQMNTGRNVLVFGSNEASRHGAGAAKEARLYWGAVYGVGFGPAGNSFAIPTKDWNVQTLPLPVIAHYVSRFLAYACIYPSKTFLVTAIGCGLAGYSHSQIAPMFKGHPTNCIVPDEWKEFLQ